MQAISYQKNKFVYFLFYLAYLSLAVFSYYPSYLALRVYTNLDYFFIALFVAFLVLFFILNKNYIKNIKIHFIIIILAVRMIIFVINACVKGLEGGYVRNEIVMFLLISIIFTFFYNYSSDERTEIKNLFVVFSLYSCLQLLVLFLANGFSIDKAFIVMGIGYSNYGATFLLMSIAYLTFVKTNVFEKIVIGLDVVFLVLTQSFGAYIALFVLIVIALIIKVNWRNKKSWLYFMALLAVTAILLAVFFCTSLGSSVWAMITKKLGYLFAGDFNSFGSSRVKLYKDSLQNIRKDLFFGEIENIVSDSFGVYKPTRTHNFFLESLLNYGIIGTILNAIVVVLIVFDAKKVYRSREENKASLITIISVLLHGAIEPNFFTLHFELFTWIIIGSMLATSQSKNCVILPKTKRKTI